MKGQKQMKSIANRWLIVASIGIGLGASACSSAGGAEDATASAESELVTNVGATVNIGALPNVLEGDADLYTQNGRTTGWSLSAGLLRMEPNNVAVYQVDVELQEDFIPDHTRLQFFGEVRAQLPQTMTMSSIDCNSFAGSGQIAGHQWNFVSVYSDPNPSTTHSCVSAISIKPDGNGVDNTGNAQAFVTFRAIPTP
jgi:hypothetical protein